jgi:hypothetical protein
VNSTTFHRFLGLRKGNFEIVSLRPAEGETLHSIGSKTEVNCTNASLRRLTSSYLRSTARLVEEWVSGTLAKEETPHLELKNVDTAVLAEVGQGYSTREQPLASVKKHQTTFKVAGHNPDGHYRWVRDSEGLRKCYFQCKPETAPWAHTELPEPKPIL